MSATTPGFTITAREEGLLYFLGLVLVYLASYAPPIAAPDFVRGFFSVLGVSVIIIKYELSQNAPTAVPTHYTALIATAALVLSVLGGQLSASNFASTWYVGLVVALIGAVLAAFTSIGGTIPTVKTA